MNNKQKFKLNIINSDIRIIDALNILDKCEIKILLVNHKDKYLGTITDGDIRRGLINKFLLDDSVEKLTNKSSVYINHEDYDLNSKDYTSSEVGIIPVIKSDQIIDIIINDKNSSHKAQSIDKLCEVVIMAGGEGTRMQPLTHLIPKPLIPYKHQTLIEHVMDNFSIYDKKNFIISVNYKANSIIDYFNDKETLYKTEYIHEDSPMGTIGSLSQIAEKFSKDIFVCNCDSIINLDFHEMYKFHSNNNFDFTIAACEDIINIPYGVCSVNEDFSLKSITEKPKINHLINSGLYLVNNNALGLIPKNKKFNATDLIDKCHNEGLSVGVYPFSKDLWLDVGLLSDYLAIL